MALLSTLQQIELLEGCPTEPPFILPCVSCRRVHEGQSGSTYDVTKHARGMFSLVPRTTRPTPPQ